MRHSPFRFAAIAALAAIALAACSSSAKTSSATTPPTNAPAAGAPTSTATGSGGPATVKLGDSSFGKILVDSNGMTLYLDENDKPGNPACTTGCLSAWPPLVAPASPTFGPGLTASAYTTVAASDGTKQLAVKGFPLYTWTGDTKPGDVTGEGKNGFSAVQADGTKYVAATKSGGY